jgi:transposase InsO family protein
MKGATMLATLQQLGIVPSFSRPSVSDDNPYSEAMFRTLKYTPAYPAKPFESIHQARTWVHKFVTWYNTQHRHSGIAFVTPEQRHQGQDHQILQKRKSVYEAAKRQMPNRWKSRTTRQWQGNQAVWLNPKKDRSHPLKTMV